MKVFIAEGDLSIKACMQQATVTLYISAAVDLSITVLIIVKVNYRKDKHLGYIYCCIV